MNLPRPGSAVTTLALIGALVAAPAAADPLFQSAFESYDVGRSYAFNSGSFQSTPTSVAVGDMNGDGAVDLVVAAPGGPAGAFSGNTVSVLLGRAGSAAPPLFQPKINSTTGTGPIAVALGDLNGDGKLDAVTADYAGNTISVLFGDGAGSLTLASQKSVGTSPRSVAVGDLTGDGLPDVAVANSGSNTISVFLNIGGGVLGARADYATQVEPRAVVMGQFDANASVDVVAANYVTGTISLFLNTGAGALNPAVNIPVGNKPTALAIGLLDGNRTTDVAVACSSRVVTRLGNGAGGFGGGLNLAVPVDAQAITVRHFTGAAVPDIAVAGLAAPGAPNVAIVPDVSGATSGTPLLYYGGPAPWGIAGAALVSASDDIVVANTGDMAAADPTHTITVLRRNLFGGFGTGIEFAAGTDARRVASGDLNRDGIADLVIGGATPNALLVATGLGDGTFAGPSSVAVGSADVGWVAVADLNRDGILDILYERLDTFEIDWVPGTGTGSFGAPAVVASGYGTPCALGDLNRDGITDLVATVATSAQVFLGTGTGTFTAEAGYVPSAPATQFRSITLGDLDRNGTLDMVIATDAGAVRYLGNTNGTFTAELTLLPTHATRAGVIADLNGDGLPDLALVDEGIAPFTADETQGITLLPGDGLGGFGSPLLSPALDIPHTLAAADVNRDGKPDLLGKNSAAAQPDQQCLSVLLGNGAGSFAARTDYAAGSSPLGLALADFNRDGLLDAAGAGRGNPSGTLQGRVHILRGSAPGTFGGLGPKTDYNISGMAAAGIASGDVDRDGKPDVVMVGTISGMPYAVTQLGNGAGAFQGGILSNLSGLEPRSVALADLNRDGNLDMIVGNGNSPNVYVLLGNGGVFGLPGASATNVPPYFVAVGDINRDGILDLATANPNSNTVSILIGSGNGGFAGPVQLGSLGGITGIGIGDLNRDGLPDIVTTGGGTGVARVHVQNPDGSFSLNGNVTIGPGPLSPVFGDFNRDGILDVAVGSHGAGGRVTILLADADGRLGMPGDYSLPTAPTQLAVGDMNGDGALDLVASMPGTVSVLIGAGGPGGGFNPAVHYAAATAEGAAIADMNLDGRPDVVAGNSNELTSSVFLNGGSVPTGVAVGGTPAAAPRLMQNAPNPFNPRTVIRFAMPRAGHARLTVYDAAGRRVATLLDGPAAAGERRVEWTGRDDAGRAVASGIYFYRLEADGAALSRRMALLQ